MSILFQTLLAVALIGSGDARAPELQVLPPRSVKVLPVFYVPKGEAEPTVDQADRLMRHVDWARRRYAELLPGHATFEVQGRRPFVYRGKEDLAGCRALPEGGAAGFAGDLMRKLGYTRYNSPYVFLVLLMNPVDDYPYGGARPLNGGYGTGGGIVILSSTSLDRSPNFQSTLQHELGHSFGLPHVDVYGYDMGSNDSFMSYSPRHQTNGFIPSPTPGKLIPEDIRGLALNRRAFPKLRFDPKRDVPSGYRIAPRVVCLGPMDLPGQLDRLNVSTDSGEEDGSSVDNVLLGPALPSGRLPVFAPATMWRSAKSQTGWVSLQVEFPLAVPLTRVAVHTMRPRDSDAAVAVRVSVPAPGGRFRAVAERSLTSADGAQAIPRTTARVWRFEFRTGPSGSVVIRGLQFFTGANEIFPPQVPFPGR